MKTGNQYVYVDESGRPEVFNRLGANLVTSGQTSKHLVIAALRCTDPSKLGREVANAAPVVGGKNRVLHASKDSPSLRLKVCRTLASLDIISTVIVMDKTKMTPGGPWQTDRTRFYNDLLAYVLADHLHLHPVTAVLLSRKDYDKGPELQAMIKSIGDRHRVLLGRMARWEPHSVTVDQRPHATSRGLQAADYIAYAVFQAFERRDMTYAKALEPILGRVWDLANLTNYTRRNPLK